MKKILAILTSLLLILNLSACSSSTNKDDVIDFFDAFDNTLSLKSASITGSLDMSDSAINVDCDIIQDGNLQIRLDMGLQGGNNVQDNFLNFYIKDGKTYLNSMGTTSQSTIDKIGLKTKSKLKAYDPFLDYTDDELCEFVTSTKRDNDTITLDLDADKLALLLDSLGTVDIDDANVQATIKNKRITHLILNVTGSQTINEQNADIDIHLDVKLKNINKLTSIEFPDNLESF